MGACGGCFQSDYCSKNSTSRNSARTRRRRIRLCRSASFTGYSALQTGLQHEVSGNLRRLRNYDVSLRTNCHRNSFGAIARELRNKRAYLFRWEATGKFYRWNWGRGQLRASFRQSLGAWTRCTCNSFCRIARPRRRIPIIEQAKSTGRRTALARRFAYGAGTSHEATRIVFHPLWRGLSFSW